MEYNVTDWAGFLEAIAIEGAIVNIAENTVFDLNVIAPEGLTSTIQVYCATINGNNSVIKNITVSGQISVFNFNTTTTVNDLHFLNFWIRGDGSSYILLFDGVSTSYSTSLYRCKLAGILSNTACLCIGDKICRFYQSSINLRLYNGGIGYWHDYSGRVSEDFRIYCYNTIINVTGSHTNGSDASFVLFLENSKLIGDVSRKVCNLEISGVNGVVDINIHKDSYVTRIFHGWSSYLTTQNIVVNTDKAFVNSNHSGYYIQVNSSQLLDASYLASKNFPIGEQ